MNLKEYAKEKGLSLAEAKKKTGLTHWKQEVIETESKQEPSSENKAPKSKSANASVADARALREGAGDKTRTFLKFVKENKVGIPEEYERVKSLIERFGV